MNSDRQALLAATTPRPWIADQGDISGQHSGETYPHSLHDDFFYNEADADLIVAAVNEYECHLRIEEALRVLVGMLRPDHPTARFSRDALEDLDRVRHG